MVANRRRRKAATPPASTSWNTPLKKLSIGAFILGAGLLALEIFGMISGVTTIALFLMIPAILIWVLSYAEKNKEKE